MPKEGKKGLDKDVYSVLMSFLTRVYEVEGDWGIRKPMFDTSKRIGSAP